MKIELADASLLEKYGALECLRETAVSNLRTVLGLTAKVTLVSPRTLERFEGKAKRILDLRGND